MTVLLKELMDKVKELPEEKQDAFAAFMLQELESDRKWDDAFSRSQDLLAGLAREAMEEYRAGKTEELDPDKL